MDFDFYENAYEKFMNRLQEEVLPGTVIIIDDYEPSDKPFFGNQVLPTVHLRDDIVTMRGDLSEVGFTIDVNGNPLHPRNLRNFLNDENMALTGKVVPFEEQKDHISELIGRRLSELEGKEYVPPPVRHSAGVRPLSPRARLPSRAAGFYSPRRYDYRSPIQYDY